jgi:hypothetical protein
MDIAYLVADKPVPYHEELRYSLRSVQKWVPHERVWLVGCKPEWVQNVQHVPVEDGDRLEALSRKIQALADSDISDRFVMLDCDMMALGRSDITVWVSDLDVFMRERLSRAPGDYFRQVAELAYSAWEESGLVRRWTMENHWPQLLEKPVLRNVLDRLPDGVPKMCYMAVYGALMGRVVVDDVKVLNGPIPDDVGPWVSLDDWSWKTVAGNQIRAMYPDASVYEKTPI